MVIPPRMIDVMKQKGLKPMARFIYHNLATRADQHGRCYVSAKRLAKDCGLSMRRLPAHVTSLVKSGMVDRVSGGGKNATRYRVKTLDELSPPLTDRQSNPLTDRQDQQSKREQSKREQKSMPDILPEYMKCAEHLRDRIQERCQIKITEAKMRSWANDVRLMVERDGRTVEEVYQIIDECQDMQPTASGFSWRDNILSTGKLREKWNEGKIYIGMAKKAVAPVPSEPVPPYHRAFKD